MTRRLPIVLMALCCLTASGRAEDGTFDSDGVKIHYMVAGKGEPVLLIHGFGASALTNWVLPGIMRELAKDYQVVALDCRGHGRSGKPHDPKQYGLPMAEDAVRLLDHLKIAKAHVVGYSMGGGIAFHLAACHPERVRSVTVGGWGLSLPGDMGKLFKELAESIDQGKGIGPLLLALSPPEMPKPSEAQIEAGSKLLMMVNDAKALAACVRGFSNPDVPQLDVEIKKLKAAKIPILALVGELDAFRPGAEALKKQLPDARLAVVEGGDHINAFMRPGFLTALKEFLAKQRAAPKESEP
jgi:pimeloyl-ACP methyl ester carboxylesterase